MTLRRLLCASGLLGILVASACSSEEPRAPEPSIPCTAAEASAGMDPAANVRVFVDDTLPEQVRADVAMYLERMWKTPVAIQLGTPLGQPGDAIWISTSPEAKTAARHATDAASSFSLARADEGARKVIVAHAATREDLTSATYALLEELGVRFFHPMQELVPELGSPFFPRGLDAHRTAMTKVRGLQPHILHPIEWMPSLHEPSDASLAEAKKLVDWIVKTGQNHLQWPLMAAPWEPLAEHSRKIADYAHARGITIGAVVQMHHKASLQKNYVLVTDDAKHEEQIASGLTRLMQVPWDEVELAMGEFLTTDPEALIEWLDLAVAHLGKIAPNVRVAVQNHVGNYENLYVDFRGTPRTYFYHLPRFADARLGQTVHTLFWFDLYREGGMYQHPNFHFQRDFILEELAKNERRVRYFPESAYWIATDVDVPAFLPEFIESRWIDIHRLDEDIRARNLPPLDGHVLFSSGHEWNYWMTDYLTAKMLWEPAATLERFFGHYASAYGSCGPKIGEDLGRFVDLQRRYLFEKKLVAYVSGEDNAVDLGALVAGVTIRELRKKFDDLVTGSEEERVSFETGMLADLQALAREVRPIEDDVAAHCRGSDETLGPWCNELRDGIRVVRMRLEHSVLLYRSVLAYGRQNKADALRLFAAAKAKTDEAAPVIQGRAKSYRFDAERLTGSYANTTNYAFGYLRQAHTQCLWHRQNEQAKRIVEDDTIGSFPTGLPSCLD
ncbi:MAG: hypothetical protein BGO98_26830 [Myxococcales bacterium 68-20]|nr:MAG: hypothetical protein BGO98_26830 [Myxococcales bacterium 68-20]